MKTQNTKAVDVLIETLAVKLIDDAMIVDALKHADLLPVWDAALLAARAAVSVLVAYDMGVGS